VDLRWVIAGAAGLASSLILSLLDAPFWALAVVLAASGILLLVGFLRHPERSGG
jgi:hypothetical protein